MTTALVDASCWCLASALVAAAIPTLEFLVLRGLGQSRGYGLIAAVITVSLLVGATIDLTFVAPPRGAVIAWPIVLCPVVYVAGLVVYQAIQPTAAESLPEMTQSPWSTVAFVWVTLCLAFLFKAAAMYREARLCRT
jgi:hypothetical protein